MLVELRRFGSTFLLRKIQTGLSFERSKNCEDLFCSARVFRFSDVVS